MKNIPEKIYLQLGEEITRLQEKYDENGYNCPLLIKLSRIEQHVDMGYTILKDQVTKLTAKRDQYQKEAIEAKIKVEKMKLSNKALQDIKWVKASESLPEDRKVDGGILSCNGFYYCRCEDDVVDLCQFKTDWGEFRHITVGCKCQEYKEERANVIEWLDESMIPKDSKQVLAALENKDEAVINKIKSAEEMLEKYEWSNRRMKDGLTRFDRIKKAMEEYRKQGRFYTEAEINEIQSAAYDAGMNAIN